MADVTIGEVESVKLYLAIQQFVYGKSVTMEHLERIGRIHQRKHEKLAIQYMNRKRNQKEKRLFEQRRKR